MMMMQQLAQANQARGNDDNGVLEALALSQLVNGGNNGNNGKRRRKRNVNATLIRESITNRANFQSIVTNQNNQALPPCPPHFPPCPPIPSPSSLPPQDFLPDASPIRIPSNRPTDLESRR